MSRRFTAVAVMLPVLALAIGIARSEAHLGGTTTFRLPVEGYDPRDLLRGRYLRYRVRRDAAPAMEACIGEQCCLCLAQQAPPRLATCTTARAACEGALPTRHLEDLGRYYVPEQHATQLERRFIEAARLGQAHIVVALDREGRPHVHHLELAGEVVE